MSARGMDLLLVVGSKNSSNAARLVEVGAARGVRGFLIDSANEIQSEWCKGVTCAAVTAGASTPEDVVQGVLSRLRELGGTSVEYVTTAEEDTVFQIPFDLRRAMEEKARVRGSEGPMGQVKESCGG